MSNQLVSLQDVERIGTIIAQSGLFGAKKPQEAIALCLLAQAYGMHPAMAAQDFDIIQGRPAKKSDAMLRTFIENGGKVEWHKLDDIIADATFSHPSGGSLRITWDMNRAKQAGLGGKDMWKKYPRQMLRARCVSEGVRSVFPAATAGTYVPEEIMDFESKPEKDVTPQPAPTPMPEKVKQAAAKAQGKAHKPDLNVVGTTIEGEATHVRGTISGDPNEGNLDDIAAFKPTQETLGKVIHAFAAIGFTLPALEKEYGKPISEWMNDDIPEARELLKALKISAAQAKAQAAEMAEHPDGGEI